MKHYPPRKTGPHTGWSPGRDRATQARFRRRLIQQAGGLICQRCRATGVELQAHHTSPDDGLLLCRPCHRAVDPHAR